MFSSWVGGNVSGQRHRPRERADPILEKRDVHPAGQTLKVVKFTEKHATRTFQYGTRVDVSELLLEHRESKAQVTLVNGKGRHLSPSMPWATFRLYLGRAVTNLK
jgi:hypothetical protein